MIIYDKSIEFNRFIIVDWKVMEKRPTQEKIARIVGVSRATVSLVINNKTDTNVRVGQNTKKRILQVAKDLGYEINLTARGLRIQKTHLLSIMVPDITNPFYPLLIRGAQEIADKHDYHLLVYDTHYSAEHEKTFINRILQRWVDGAMMMAFHLTSEDIGKLKKSGIEVVAFGEELGRAGIESVGIIYKQAINELIRHLVDRNHSRIAHLAGPLDTLPGKQRLQAYKEALKEYGIQYDPALVRYGCFEREGVEEAIRSLFDRTSEMKRPTALFAANDVMAIEAMHVLVQLGYQIPKDVAVCGFDNIPESAYVYPALTTIQLNAQEFGRRAAELLIERLNGKRENKINFLQDPCKLIIREST